MLQDFEWRAAAGEKFDTMTYSEVVEEADQHLFSVVSLAVSYRSSFAQVIDRRGIDRLIQQLSAK